MIVLNVHDLLNVLQQKEKEVEVDYEKEKRLERYHRPYPRERNSFDTAAADDSSFANYPKEIESEKLYQENNKLREETLNLSTQLESEKRDYERVAQQCEQLKKEIEELKQTVTDKNQEVIDIMSDMDSSTFSNYESKIRPHNVLKQFEALLDSVHELQSVVKDNYDSISENSRDRMKNVYKKILESLFESGLWKILRKPMESKRLLKQSMCLVLAGKQSTERGMNKDTLERYLLPHIESNLRNIIERDIGLHILDDRVNECIRESAENALTLAALSIVSKPTMGIILPYRGDIYNPEKHEDATCEVKMIISSVQRPGLLCTRDNKVFVKASVETEMKDA